MANIDDEIERLRETIHAFRQIPPNESEEQTAARVSQVLAMRKNLDKLEREKMVEIAVAKRFASGAPAPTKGTERRAIVGELRAKGRRLEGYAATFGAEAKIGNSTETIAPGAFAASLAERDDILALVDHDPGRVLARTKSGTLRLAEDSHGLAFDLDLPPTTVANDVLALAERGDIGGASFAFVVKRDRWDRDGERRTLEAVDLHEISIVSAWPAYNGTIVQARARPDLSSDLSFRNDKLTLPPRVAAARRYLDSL